MNRHEDDPLLNELLTGSELARFREDSLQHGLDALRRQRRRARAVQCGLLAAVPVLALALTLVLRDSPDPVIVSAPPANSVPGPSPAALPEQPSVEMVDDAELFALFPDRSLALIGPPGKQQLVFLDDLASN